jgi:lysine biosynthesis protein LysW
MDIRTRTATASTAAAVDAAASCPDCGRAISLAPQSKMGQRAICRRCGADLELVSLEPPELDWFTTEFETSWRSFDHYWR